jgi:nicotinate phosphoribosyltransferase
MMVPSSADDSRNALLTDLYELTMLQSYFDAGMKDTAVFDLFIRRLPSQRNYLIACGLEHVLHYLETLSFDSAAIDYLRTLNRFSDAFLMSLRSFRFTGDVYALREGTPFFANEPILEIVAPLPEAQIVETFILNQIHMATLAASKASRVVNAAKGRSVVDFGARAMHGADAATKQPRAFYIAGMDSTSSVLAGETWGIPVSGTMAHSYILSFEDEISAFRQFLRTYPTSILLIDTFDVNIGVEHVIDLAREMGAAFQVSGVRLDSGDVARQACEVRQRLDSAGLHTVRIFATSSLDEYEIDKIVSRNVPIDGFGVGRNLASSSDVPVLDMVYKLTQYAGQPKMKFSESKLTLPGQKQIFRERSSDSIVRDVVGLADEKGNSGEPLLTKVMEQGRRTGPPETLEQCRACCKAQVSGLPQRLLQLSSALPGYPVEISAALTHLSDIIRKKK